ncbi:MAG: DASS family sodium-coupled anion symporter [Rhodospirillales bacterium]|nr:DASS family sodium-coupled anion symporter [Rhodospirillales bacterium]MCW8861093.1 DASS family sodium-coupled anion symporter [Rhodospirillales bacterium]MCW8952220.1 DASS family sodium-coupled anion symporter [Rhodospirillales bacterium]MCW8970563.1 DASS family sodium-coupled anion symporter [Rhodospirillales bacterium]MCW9002819.1 DASS family sodium-coupled anion symporter [Rhodospirillales bacterium]
MTDSTDVTEGGSASPGKRRKVDLKALRSGLKRRDPAKQILNRFRRNLYFFWEKRWLFIAFAVGAGLILMPLPEGMSGPAMKVLAMSVVATILFVTEPVPLPTVALMIIVAQVLLLGLDSTDVARSLMKDSVLFIMGSLMLAVAVVKQKLDKRIAFLIVRMTGTKTAWIAFGISVVSGVLASFVGEHTVAAMMLPVGITLISLTSDDPKKVRNLAAVLLFSISYGCSVAGIGTPSGGARNAIMIGYWKDFFYDPTNPETYKYLIDYMKWMMYAYPMFLLQLPFVTLILLFTFRPEYSDLSRAVVKLRTQIAEQGSMKVSDWVTITLFFLILLGWIFFSGQIGMGTVAILGAATFLAIGLVKWEDVNNGVNWGVVLLYAAAISLGVQMKDTGAAKWVAESFLALLTPIGADQGIGLWAAVSVLTTGVTNTMSNGAAVAVLGPIVLKLAVVADESPIIIGFITAVSSAFAYLTVVGTPACTIVYSSGYLKTTDFLTVGWKMAVMSTVVMLGAAAVYWPMLS